MTDDIADRHDANVRPAYRQEVDPLELETATPPIPRDFKTSFDQSFLAAYHKGTMNYTYKGMSCLKDPIDLALYIKLIWDLKPASIIEIGSFHGGAAHFYADLTDMYDMHSRIVTVDFRSIQACSNERVEFIPADAMNLESSALHAALDDLPKPWLVLEDSAHTFEVCFSVLAYFRTRMRRGEVLVMEDGVIEDQGAKKHFTGGPNLAIYKFFKQYPDDFRVMTEYTDFFGRNATFNPNGYLEKIS